MSAKKRASKIEIHWPSPGLKRLLATVYNRYQKLENPAANRCSREDFVFHMTDWLDDLDRIWEVYKNPECTSKEAAADAVFGLLIHAVPHLKAAGRLLLDEISDPFEDADKQVPKAKITPVKRLQHPTPSRKPR